MPPLRRNYNSERSSTSSRTSRTAPRRRPGMQTRPSPRNSEQEVKSTPVLLKILSWLGVLLLFFVLGYLGTTWVVKMLGEKLFLKPEERVETQEDLSQLQETVREKVAESQNKNAPQVNLNLYHVMNDSIVPTQQNFTEKVPEDNISDAINAIISLSEMPNSDKIRLLHVFRNSASNTVFLDMSEQFASSLASAGKRKSLLLLTGIVRTMTENFKPISQVRFLINSKTPSSGGEVDLASAWKMPK